MNHKILIATLEDFDVISLNFLLYLALSAYQAAYGLNTKHNQVRTNIGLHQ